MPEYININIGGAGSKVGLKFWEQLYSTCNEETGYPS